MNVYEEYSKTKKAIEVLSLKLKELQPVILEEIKTLSAPMDTEFGKFSTIKSSSWTFSKDFDEARKTTADKIKDYTKPLNEKLAEMKQKEIESGKATRGEDVSSLRFYPKKA